MPTPEDRPKSPKASAIKRFGFALTSGLSKASGYVLSATDWIGKQLHISSKWASRFGFVVLWGVGMTFIQVDEYFFALVCWIASAIVLLSKAIHWQPLSQFTAPTRIRTRKAFYVLAAILFVPVSVIWTQAKRGNKAWTNLPIIQALFVSSSQPRHKTGQDSSPVPPTLGATPHLSFFVSAIQLPHTKDDIFGGFKWDNPRYVDMRLLITNAGAVAEKLVIEVRTPYMFWHIFQVEAVPGVSVRLANFSGAGGVGFDFEQNGTKFFMEPQGITFSSDAEIRCDLLDTGQNLLIGFAVTPRDLNAPRSIPAYLDLKTRLDIRTSTGVQRVQTRVFRFPVTVSP